MSHHPRSAERPVKRTATLDQASPEGATGDAAEAGEAALGKCRKTVLMRQWGNEITWIAYYHYSAIK
jgi:hypothetical protein